MALANIYYPDRTDALPGLSFETAPRHYFSSVVEQELEQEDHTAVRNVAREMAAVMVSAILLGALVVLWIAFVAH